MDFDYTDEQRQLRDTLQRYIAKQYTFDARRKLAQTEQGYSREHWQAFADLGLLALTLPEAHGGLGGNAIDTMVAMEPLAPALLLEPYLATVVICGGLIADAGSDAQKDALLSAVGAGELLLAFAHCEPGTRYERNHVATTAKSDGDGYVLNGAKTVVSAGDQADRLIVSARTAGGVRDHAGISLFTVDRAASGVGVRGYPTQDGTRAAEITLTGVRVDADARLGAAGGALPLIEHAIDRGIAALCGEAVGLMAALNAATLEYLKTREQFGGPIGRFQALQHRMVDMFIAAEEARSMAILASVGVQSADPAERRRTVSMAKARVGQSSRFVGQQAVQLHGGMGVTDDLVVSHWFKRLTTIDLLFGDADHHVGLVSDQYVLG
jgi:alkylation response protein AidB-like acyl-CoA dehydrogenase